MAHVEKTPYSNTLHFCFPEVHEDLKFSITFQRTYRLPNDEKDYPLPPGLGSFELEQVEDFGETAPADWVERGGVMLPMYASEAMWLHFSNGSAGGVSFPFAVKVSAGMRSAVTGDKRQEGLAMRDYLVTEKQKWLDGFVVEKGVIRQFVSTPLGQGQSVEEQLSGKAEFGGLQIEVFPMKKDLVDARIKAKQRAIRPTDFAKGGVTWAFCSEAPVGWDGQPVEYEQKTNYSSDSVGITRGRGLEAKSLGMGAGGRMTQQVFEDTLGLETWDQTACAKLYVHLVEANDWKQIVGRPVRHAPLTESNYKTYNVTWYDYYADKDTLSATNQMAKIKPLDLPAQPILDKPAHVHPSGLPVKVIGSPTPGNPPPPARPKNAIKDGTW